MSTLTGNGVSTAPHAEQAVGEAMKTALTLLGGRKPTYGFIFASPKYALGDALRAAAKIATTADIIGCTTAGEITEAGLVHDGIVVFLVASDTNTAKKAFALQLKGDPKRAADDLLWGMNEVRRSALAHNQRHLTTVLLTDGLCGAGEALVTDLHDRGQSGSQIVGGAAGDEAKFEATYVGAGERASADAAAALHVFSDRPWGIGVNHGLRSTTKLMRVTKAEGNVIHELDGVPAFEIYKRHGAERGIALTPGNASSYLIANELGIHFFDKINRARAPLSVGPDGSLSCAAAVPKGSMVSILDGDPDSMVAAAKSAAEEAKTRLGDSEVAGVLLFDCVCRGMILKTEFRREVEAMRSVFGDVPIAGFLTYGEIARHTGNLDGWHNTTAVVAAIPK